MTKPTIEEMVEWLSAEAQLELRDDGVESRHYRIITAIRDHILAQQANTLPLEQANPMEVTSSRELVDAIADLFNVGKYARRPETILTNVKNAARRSSCLSLVEHRLFTTKQIDEDGEEFEDCQLNWADEPEVYVKRMESAMMEKQANTLPLDEIPEGFELAYISHGKFSDGATFCAQLRRVDSHTVIYKYASTPSEAIRAAIAAVKEKP